MTITPLDPKRRGQTRQRQPDVAVLTAQIGRLIRAWAEQFKRSHRLTVEGVVAHGHMLNRGKKELGYGNFCAAIEIAGLSLRTCEYYMLVANQPWAVPKSFSLLPSSVSSLRFLASLQAEFVQELLDHKRINAGMTKAELVALVEPTTPQDEPKVQVKRRAKDSEIVWTQGLRTIDERAKTFFGGRSTSDFRITGEVLWEGDGESVVLAPPQVNSNKFHNRIVAGTLVLLPLGQRFVLFYTGRRRDEFAAVFGEPGDTFVVSWGE